MRYPDGGGLTAEERGRREQVRPAARQAAERRPAFRRAVKRCPARSGCSRSTTIPARQSPPVRDKLTLLLRALFFT